MSVSRKTRSVAAALMASGALATAFVVGDASAATAAPASGVCANLGLISVRLGLGAAGAPRCDVGVVKVCLGPVASSGCDTTPVPPPPPPVDEPSA